MKILIAIVAALALFAADAKADGISFDFATGGNFDPSGGGGLGGSDTITGVTVETGKGDKDDWWQKDKTVAVVFKDGGSGLTITATAANAAGAAQYVYGDTWGTNAGLGVYTAAGPAGANDNITTGERLILVFSERVSLETTHTDTAHNLFTGSQAFELWVDGVKVTTNPLLSAGVGGIAGTKFEFVGISTANQFYVNALTATPVPEPTTLSLLAGGLTVLALRRRRRGSRTA